MSGRMSRSKVALTALSVKWGEVRTGSSSSQVASGGGGSGEQQTSGSGTEGLDARREQCSRLLTGEMAPVHVVWFLAFSFRHQRSLR